MRMAGVGGVVCMSYSAMNRGRDAAGVRELPLYPQMLRCKPNVIPDVAIVTAEFCLHFCYGGLLPCLGGLDCEIRVIARLLVLEG
jgi:hypothetical protein